MPQLLRGQFCHLLSHLLLWHQPVRVRTRNCATDGLGLQCGSWDVGALDGKGSLVWPSAPKALAVASANVVVPSGASWSELLVAGAAVAARAGRSVVSSSDGMGSAGASMLSHQLDALPGNRRAVSGAPGARFSHLTISELKDELRKRELKVTGNKPDLLARLDAAVSLSEAAGSAAGAAAGGSGEARAAPAHADVDDAPMELVAGLEPGYDAAAGGAASAVDAAPQAAAEAPKVCCATLTHGNGCSSCCANLHGVVPM